jgi:hypothetical protein
VPLANQHILNPPQVSAAQEPLESKPSYTSDINDPPFIPSCFFVDNPNQGGTPNLLVDIKWEGKSSESRIPIPMKDEDGNPIVGCHRQQMMDEYVWSMDILNGSTLESKKEDHVDEHQSYILEEPQDPCFHAKSLESIFPSTYTYESYTHPMLLFY